MQKSACERGCPFLRSHRGHLLSRPSTSVSVYLGFSTLETGPCSRNPPYCARRDGSENTD
jgi:hypothetical protein